MKHRYEIQFTDGSVVFYDQTQRQPEGVTCWNGPIADEIFFYPWVKIRCVARFREEEAVRP